MSRRGIITGALAALALAGAAAPAHAGVLPTLGFGDREMVLMGASDDEAPGEAWGYRLLPLAVPPLGQGDDRLAFGPIANALAPAPQLVFTRTDAATGTWRPDQTPVDEQGRPYRGMTPLRRSARTTPKGGGLLVGADSSRQGASAVVLLVRDPGGRFRVLPTPGPDVLTQPGEALATNGGGGRSAATAVDGRDGRTEVFAGIVGGDGDEDAVAHWDGSRWTREAVEVPAALPAPAGTPTPTTTSTTPAPTTTPTTTAPAPTTTPTTTEPAPTTTPTTTATAATTPTTTATDGPVPTPVTPAADTTATTGSTTPAEAPAAPSFHLLALAGTSGGDTWLLAQTTGRNEGIVLLRRTTDPSGTAVWRQQPLGDRGAAFRAASDPDRGTSDVAPLGDEAQPLTATSAGVWVDGSLVAPGSDDARDFSLFVTADGGTAGSFCDVRDDDGAALCDHPLGFRFGRRAGYRSFAWASGGTFGSRVVTGPEDVDGDESTNRGSYVVMDGDGHVDRRPGAGGSLRTSAAFSSPDQGWLEGPVQLTDAAAPDHLAPYPSSVRSPFTAVTTAPGATPGDPNAQALAVGAFGGVSRFTPGAGWQREFLLTGTGAVTSPTLRGVAWPEATRAYAVGDLGAMWLWRSETGLWERDPATPVAFDGNLMGVAFDPADASRGYAVGRGGVLLAYDKTWTQQPLPAGFAQADLTGIAFAGRQALVAAGSGVLVNDGGAWREDPGVEALLATAPSTARITTVAGLADGGAVAAGQDVVLVRDTATGPWREATPLPGTSVVSAAATRGGDGRVRPVVAAAPEAAYPVETPVTFDPSLPPAVVPPFALPGDGYLLRETGSGWEDEQRTDFAGSQDDRPVKSDPIGAFALAPDGTGWVVGGWSGQPDNAGRGTAASGPGTLVRQRVQTALLARFTPSGTPPAAPGTAQTAIALDPSKVTLAVAGHATCDAPCSQLAAQGIGPDRTTQALVGAVGDLAARPGGPRALLYTGGRLPVDATIRTPQADEDRLATLLGGRAGLPVFAAVSGADSEGGGADGWRSAFGGFGAPLGTGGAAGGVSPIDLPGSPVPGSGARTHYAFDTAGQGGTVRVVVIDNSRGSLSASDPHQNPAEPQRPWLEAILADARAKGVPAVVMGSRDLNSRLVPRANVADDADATAQLLVDAGASAYFNERPEEQRASRIPAAGSTTIPEYGTGTLGYRSPIGNALQAGQADALFGDSGYLLAQVDVAQRDPGSNRAPVTVRLEPIVQDVSLAAVDGTLLRRSRPALMQGLGRRPPGGDRWGPVSASDGSPSPAGADPYTQFPPQQCLQANCTSRVTAEYSFTSSDPDIADFVRQDPASTNLRKPLQGPDGKVITDGTSGLLCPFNPGTTTITVTAGGRSASQVITVLAGSVQQPCGTRPLDPSRFRTPAAAGAAPPPAPAPTPAATPAASPAPAPPPPAPPVPAVTPAPVVAKAKPPAKPVQLPPPFLPAAPLDPLVAQPPQSAPSVPAAFPPPAGGFGRPIPPGGAVARVFEEKREEEVAPEQSSAASAYDPDDQPGGVPAWSLVVVLALAGGSVGLRERARRRPRHVPATVRATATTRDASPLHHPRRRP